jgi:hypothetical protein
MKNPIPHSNLFLSPQSFEELMLRLEDLSGTDQERRLMFTGAMIALNCSHNMVEAHHVAEAV